MKIKITFLISLFLILGSFLQLQARKRLTDNRLVGSWSGSEKDDQIKGVQITWIQHRFKNGIVITNFRVKQNETESTFTEEGKWWVENGLFYEQVKGEQPDIYTYEAVDVNHIIFKAKKLHIAFENKNYQFVDTRVEGDKTTDK